LTHDDCEGCIEEMQKRDIDRLDAIPGRWGMFFQRTKCAKLIHTSHHSTKSPIQHRPLATPHLQAIVKVVVIRIQRQQAAVDCLSFTEPAKRQQQLSLHGHQTQLVLDHILHRAAAPWVNRLWREARQQKSGGSGMITMDSMTQPERAH